MNGRILVHGNQFKTTSVFFFWHLKARQMPLTSGMLRRLVKSKHPFVERNLEAVVSVIKNAAVNAARFEPIVEHLKNNPLEVVI